MIAWNWQSINQSILAWNNKKFGKKFPLKLPVSAKSKGGGTNPVEHVWKLGLFTPHPQMRCCIHKEQWIIIKKEITACTPMWLGVKCPCRPLCQLPHWRIFRLSRFCTCFFCIYYTLFKLFFSGYPKLRCFKALKSLDLMKRMWVI